MKENTVLLPIQDYNDLRDFRNTYQNDGLIISYEYGRRYFITQDDALIELRNDLKRAEREKIELLKEISQLKKTKEPWWKKL